MPLWAQRSAKVWAGAPCSTDKKDSALTQLRSKGCNRNSVDYVISDWMLAVTAFGNSIFACFVSFFADEDFEYAQTG